MTLKHVFQFLCLPFTFSLCGCEPQQIAYSSPPSDWQALYQPQRSCLVSDMAQGHHVNPDLSEWVTENTDTEHKLGMGLVINE